LRHRHRFNGFGVENEAQRVHVVHGDFEHDAAACLGLANAPALQVRGQAHGVEHASEQRLADRTVAHELSDRLVRRGIAQVMVGAEHDTGPCGTRRR